jgi:hypothetical protein
LARLPSATALRSLEREAFEDAAWATVFALALGIGAAVLGAVLATREEISRVW